MKRGRRVGDHRARRKREQAARDAAARASEDSARRRCAELEASIVVEPALIDSALEADDLVPALREIARFGNTATHACRSVIEELLVDLARMHGHHRCTGEPLEVGEHLWTLAAEVATSKSRRDAAVRNVATLAWNRGWHTWTPDGWHHAAAEYRVAAANEPGDRELLRLAAAAEELAYAAR